VSFHAGEPKGIEGVAVGQEEVVLQAECEVLPGRPVNYFPY
jgi:hypothetical protein